MASGMDMTGHTSESLLSLHHMVSAELNRRSQPQSVHHNQDSNGFMEFSNMAAFGDHVDNKGPLSFHSPQSTAFHARHNLHSSATALVDPHQMSNGTDVGKHILDAAAAEKKAVDLHAAKNAIDRHLPKHLRESLGASEADLHGKWQPAGKGDSNFEDKLGSIFHHSADPSHAKGHQFQTGHFSHPMHADGLDGKGWISNGLSNVENSMGSLLHLHMSSSGHEAQMAHVAGHGAQTPHPVGPPIFSPTHLGNDLSYMMPAHGVGHHTGASTSPLGSHLSSMLEHFGHGAASTDIVPRPTHRSAFSQRASERPVSPHPGAGSPRDVSPTSWASPEHVHSLGTQLQLSLPHHQALGDHIHGKAAHGSHKELDIARAMAEHVSMANQRVSDAERETAKAQAGQAQLASHLQMHVETSHALQHLHSKLADAHAAHTAAVVQKCEAEKALQQMMVEHKQMERRLAMAESSAESHRRLANSLADADKGAAQSKAGVLGHEPDSVNNICGEPGSGHNSELSRLHARLAHLENQNSMLRGQVANHEMERTALHGQLQLLKNGVSPSASAPTQAMPEFGFAFDPSARTKDQERDKKLNLMSHGAGTSMPSGFGSMSDLHHKARAHYPAAVHPNDKRQPRMIESKASAKGRPGQALRDHASGHAEHLDDGIDLIKSANPDRCEFQYTVVNKKLAVLNITAELTGKTENMCWAPGSSEGNKCQVSVKPKDEKQLDMLTRRNPRGAARFSLQFSWNFSPLDGAEVKSQESRVERQRDALAKQMRGANIYASKLGTAAAVQQACKRAGADTFLDVEFIPDDKALYKDPHAAGHPPVVWRRPYEFIKGRVKIFPDCIHPKDIAQGALGDCWLLAAFAALAEFPEKVKAIFKDCQYNDCGVYEIICYKNGLLTRVIVDDYFPCDPISGTPCYSHVVGNDIWVLLLEKAWAKLHGSYEQIEAGVPYHALMDITGTSGQSFMLEDNPDIFDKMCKFDDLGYLMCASTPGEDNMTKQTENRPTAGIVPGHAYTVKIAKQANGARLVCCRNPWGQFEWDGDWSDTSPLWTDQMKAIFQPTLDANDGTFWMDEEDFRQHFDALDVTYLCAKDGNEWSTSRVQLETTAQTVCNQYLSFRIDKKAAGFFTLLQQDTRMPGTPDDYSELCFGVYACDSTRHQAEAPTPTQEMLRSPCWATREVSAEATPDRPLQPGEYIIVVFNPKKVANVPFVLLVQLDCGKSAMEIKTTKGELSPCLRRDLAITIATNSKGAQKDQLGPVQTYGAFMPSGGYVLAAKNTGSSSAISATFDFSKSTGLAMSEGGDMQSVAMLRPSQVEPELIAELRSVSDSMSFALSVQTRQV